MKKLLKFLPLTLLIVIVMFAAIGCSNKESIDYYKKKYEDAGYSVSVYSDSDRESIPNCKWAFTASKTESVPSFGTYRFFAQVYYFNDKEWANAYKASLEVYGVKKIYIDDKLICVYTYNADLEVLLN